MSKWHPVTKSEPCPACEHTDWCAWSPDRASLKCERTTTAPPGLALIKAKDGGGLFRRGEQPDQSPGGRRRSQLGNRPTWAADAEKYHAALTKPKLQALASGLGVAASALEALDLGWVGDCYTFPERDGRDEVIGIVRRFDSGEKRAFKGSRRGLTIPRGLLDTTGPVLVVEGASDVAAALTLGIQAVGRPSCNQGVEMLAELLKGRDVLVVGERDEKPNGSWPGRDGARAVSSALANAWGRPVGWTLPPANAKDLRAWLQDRGLDVANRDACCEAGHEMVAAMAAEANEVCPALHVHVKNEKYGRIRATLAVGDASSPCSDDLIHFGRLRVGDDKEQEAWIVEALKLAHAKQATWVSEAVVREALARSLQEHVVGTLAPTGEDDAPGTAEMLVRMVEQRYRLGVTKQGQPFAVENDGPNLALGFRGGPHALRNRLAREFRRVHGRPPNSSALGEALDVLTGMAQELDPEPVCQRVARVVVDGSIAQIVVDMGDAAGRAIVVEPGTWRIEPRSPVLFRRTRLTGEIPEPKRDGDLEELWKHVAVADGDRPLVVGWLVHAFIPNEPHAILLLGGVQGGGKTTSAERLVSLVDPSGALTRCEPRDLRQFAITASGSWVVAYDNVSAIRPWLSDAWCRAVTGDAWVDRALFTDDDLSVVAFQRVILLTSIDPGALRGDLGDRMLLADLERIDPRRRMPKSQLDAEFAAAHPRLTGALLDLLARVLEVLPDVRPENLPRMADYARVLAALDRLRGTDGLTRYENLGERIASEVVERDALATAVYEFAQREGRWTGTVTELYDAVTPDPRPRGWPAGVNVMPGCLKRRTSALGALGVNLQPPDSKARPKRWRLWIGGPDDSGVEIGRFAESGLREADGADGVGERAHPAASNGTEGPSALRLKPTESRRREHRAHGVAKPVEDEPVGSVGSAHPRSDTQDDSKTGALDGQEDSWTLPL